MSALGTDETLIIDYLRQFPHTYISAVEICKRANGRKRYDRDPSWARPILRHMIKDGWLAANEFGQYKLIDEALGGKKCNKAERVRRLNQAITLHILRMEPEDDDKPFTVLIKEAAQDTWINFDSKKDKTG